jgi:hypothetical protein
MSALMPSTRLCFWNTCLSFSEPNHSLATLRAYRNSHQAKSTMSDLGKKKPGGTWYCICGFRVYCDADVRIGLPDSVSSRLRNAAALGGPGAESVKPGNESHVVASRAIDIAAQVKVSSCFNLLVGFVITNQDTKKHKTRLEIM